MDVESPDGIHDSTGVFSIDLQIKFLLNLEAPMYTNANQIQLPPHTNCRDERILPEIFTGVDIGKMRLHLGLHHNHIQVLYIHAIADLANSNWQSEADYAFILLFVKRNGSPYIGT